MSDVRYTDEAVSDLEEIYRRIEPSGGDFSASAMVRKLVTRAREIARMPRIGTRRNVGGLECRMFPERPYLISYRLIAEGILLMRIIHGSRDQVQALAQTDQPNNE